MNAKLADFGVAMTFPIGNDQIKSTEGTIHFFSPESCEQDADSFSGIKNDIWAFGITLYCPNIIFNF